MDSRLGLDSDIRGEACKLARAVRARSQEGVVGLDSDIWAGRMGDGEGMKCNGFF